MPSAPCPARIARPTSCHGTSGFSLIELMIAMVIGMAAVIIMMQMLSNTDTAKRITVGGNDAQVTGTIALFTLERDIRSAGYGFNADKLLGCQVSLQPQSGSSPVSLTLAPLTINPPTNLVPAGDPNTDTLLLIYGQTADSTDGDPLVIASLEDAYVVSTPAAFRAGDQVILQTADRPANCTLQISTVEKVTGSTLQIKGAKGQAGFPAGAIAYNLGQFTVRAYAIRQGNLTMCEYTVNDCGKADVDDPDIWVPVGSNIVSLLAQYGRDLADPTSAMSGQVTEYSRYTPGSHPRDATLAPQCAWARTLAVRIGLVGRNTHYDKRLSEAETAKRGEALLSPPTWSGARDDQLDYKNLQPIDFNLSDSVDSPGQSDAWRLYRYKAFETTVPLRNMILQGDDNC